MPTRPGEQIPFGEEGYYDEAEFYFPNAKRYTTAATPINHYFGCRHWRQEVLVGNHILTCSGHKDATKDNVRKAPIPDFGVYLSRDWRETMGDGWTNGVYSKRLAEARPYPALVWDWRDMSTVSQRDLEFLVEYTMTRMRGGRQVDIGCNHAHGRTGTLLACLLVRLERMTGKEAIAEVRRRYCKQAVETQAQERSIHEYSANRLARMGVRR